MHPPDKDDREKPEHPTDFEYALGGELPPGVINQRDDKGTEDPEETTEQD